MIALGETLSLTFHQKHVGTVRDVLWEATTGADERGLHWVGYSDNYMRVRACGPPDLFNRVTPVLLEEATGTSLNGTIRNGAAPI
jgi:hypothetical protein